MCCKIIFEFEKKNGWQIWEVGIEPPTSCVVGQIKYPDQPDFFCQGLITFWAV